jgi:hypothetical protein
MTLVKCSLCNHEVTPDFIRVIEGCGHKCCQQCYYDAIAEGTPCWHQECLLKVLAPPSQKAEISRKSSASASASQVEGGETGAVDESCSFECKICNSNRISLEELFINEKCNHQCCKHCAAVHIIQQTKNGEECEIPIKCFEPECKENIDPFDCELVAPPDIVQKMKKQELTEFLSSDTSVVMIQCCDNFCDWFCVMDKDSELPETITCEKCGAKFCPKCRKRAHGKNSCQDDLKAFCDDAQKYCKVAYDVYKEDIRVGESICDFKCICFKRQKDVSKLVPCPQYAILENKDANETVLAFRGTTTLWDIIVDLSFVESLDEAGPIHYGVERHLMFVCEDILKSLESRESTQKLTLVGHSLGGAYCLALLVQILKNPELMAKIESIKVMTFGSPLIYARDSLEDLMVHRPAVNVEVWNIINRNDLVPRILGKNLHGSRALAMLKKVVGKEKKESLEKLRTSLSKFKPIGSFVFLLEKIPEKQGILERIRSKKPPKQYCAEIEVGGPALTSRRADLWRIREVFDTMKDHSLDGYLEALQYVANS